jgi:hypothetical protein
MINLVRLTFNSSGQMYIAGVTVPHKVLLDIPCMVVYSCKKCGELNYLTPHAFWNIAEFDAKCEKGNLRNRYSNHSQVEIDNIDRMH